MMFHWKGIQVRVYSKAALAMDQRAVNKGDVEIYLKTTLLICLRERKGEGGGDGIKWEWHLR